MCRRPCATVTHTHTLLLYCTYWLSKHLLLLSIRNSPALCTPTECRAVGLLLLSCSCSTPLTPSSALPSGHRPFHLRSLSLTLLSLSFPQYLGKQTFLSASSETGSPVIAHFATRSSRHAAEGYSWSAPRPCHKRRGPWTIANGVISIKLSKRPHKGRPDLSFAPPTSYHPTWSSHSHILASAALLSLPFCSVLVIVSA